MQQFIAKYQRHITGVLSGFDRLVLRGSLRRLNKSHFDRERRVVVADGMEYYCWENGILFKKYGDYVRRITERLKDRSLKPLRKADVPFEFVRDSSLDKEALAREIACQRGVTSGPVCVLSALEPSPTFDYIKSRIVRRMRPCHVLYHYQIHPVLGWMYARIQTWFPFNIQIGLNGREWLARQMDQRGLGYARQGNCFPWIEDFALAQQWMNEQLETNWAELLRVPIARPRVRNRQHNREIPLGSYELFQRASLLEETVWQKIMYGLTMRNYKEVIQQFADAYGLEKTTISDHFIAASRRKLDEFMKRSLQNVSLAVMMIDGTIFKGQDLVVAIGVDRLGHKLVLSLRQGATENATLVSGLLGDLAERGVDFNQPRLYVIDGSKAIHAAIRDFAGDAAFFQRCQVHKIRNVTEYLPEAQRHAVKFRMRAAYQLTEAADAKQALFRLHDELMEANPSAAGSLAEGLDHTLTVLELRITPKLRQCLSSTNGIESSFSVVDRICKQVKRWQGSDHRLRWVGSALLFAESHWNRLPGYRHMPVLVNALETEFRRRCRQEERSMVTVA